jgi:hypothetical protein
MSRKGFLLQESDGEWSVQWSDLSSFAHGKHWCFTKLSPESNLIKVIVDGKIQYRPLANQEKRVGLSVLVITIMISNQNN